MLLGLITRKIIMNTIRRVTEKITKYGDGVDHINIGFKAETLLGRMLSHFYETPFVHPYFGPFVSMEGFWQYIKSVDRSDALRTLSGHAAKEYGKNLEQDYVEGFREIIKTANFYRIEQNPKLKKLFLECTLEFDQYYLFGPGEIIIRSAGHEWIIDGFEEIREMMWRDERPLQLLYNAVA